MSEVEALSAVRPVDFPDDWYDLGDPAHFWFRWRFGALRQALAAARAPLEEPLRALDVGCGSGVLASQLESHGQWIVDGTDLNMPALQRCTRRRGRSLYYDVTEERPDHVGRYDVVILFDILEHLPDPRVLLRSALAHLKPEGLLLINVPALPALMSSYDAAAGHLRRYTRASLSKALSGLDLRTVTLRYWGLSLLPLLVTRKFVLARGGRNVIKRGFQPPNPAVNSMLTGLMRLELRLLRAPVLGTSVLYAGRRAPVPSRSPGP